jgi:hypothetical protein
MERKGKRRFYGEAHARGREGCGARGRNVEYPDCTCSVKDNCKEGLVKCNHPNRGFLYCSILHLVPNSKTAYHCPIDNERRGSK